MTERHIVELGMSLNWECDTADRDAMKAVCRLQCPLRHNAATDNLPEDEAAAEAEVAWAGFAVNLDFAFSQNQRDKVFTQHLKRKHKAQEVRPDGIQTCACEIAAHNRNLGAGAVLNGAVRQDAMQIDAIS